MTLQSDRAGQTEQAGHAEQRGLCEPLPQDAPAGGVARIAALVRDADPGAGWAVGGAHGPDAVVEPGTAARGRPGTGAGAGSECGGRVGAGPESQAGIESPGVESGAGERAGVEHEAGVESRAGAASRAGEPAGAESPAGGRDTAPDVGGLVGVLAIWPVIGMFVDAGELALHTPLTAYGAGDGLPAGTTAHHLLTHGSGVSPALFALAERLCGSPLAPFAAARIWAPLGMTRTGFTADGALRAPAEDLGRFLSHLLAPAGGPVSRAWTAQSLRIRTGELLPARGLLWHPAAHGSWSHGEGPALWISPGGRRWAVLLPTTPSAPLRTAFRAAAFA